MDIDLVKSIVAEIEKKHNEIGFLLLIVRKEIAADTTSIASAADGNNSSTLSTQSVEKSIPTDTYVETPEGKGIVLKYLDNGDIEVQMDGSSVEAFEPKKVNVIGYKP
jgi:hypothetical protein